MATEIELCPHCGQRMDQRTPGHIALTKARLERGLTLEKAAGLAGISASHLSRAERGQTSPSYIVAQRLAGAYGCDVADLMADFVEHPVQSKKRATHEGE